MEQLPFDYRHILSTMEHSDVSYLVVGGLNYFLAHKPVATQDIDLLIDDTSLNRLACEHALNELRAEWGKRDEDWGPVSSRKSGWLWGQNVFCLITPYGPLDIFLSLPGISNFADAMMRSSTFPLESDLQVRLICAADLLACQLALPEIYRKIERVRYLQGRLENDR
jgi:hypothetical protein